MLRRRDALRLFCGSTALALSTAAARGQGPGGAQRKGARVGLGRIEEIVEEIVEEHKIAGATMAMAKDGRLVLAKGFGMADVESSRPVTTETLFSIASVTKAISAVAALRLVDMGKLRLEARLVELFAEIQPLDGPRPADPRFREITVHHLLYHAAGLSHDAPRVRPEAKAKAKKAKPDEEPGDDDEATDSLVQVYRAAMSRPLDFAPGAEHRYSNLGFLLVQLVIERASGQPYEPFVRENILAPMGIRRMVMETDAYLPSETRRYTSGPNGLRRLTGHKPSNWLATPTALVRFLTSLDGTHGKPILSDRTRTLMLAVPPPPVKPNRDGRHIGLGWDTVRRTPEGVRYSKNGGKSGVRAWLEHLPNGVDWAFLFNTGEPPTGAANGPAALPESARRIGEAAEALK
jgi:CubicO group peptidase (beta-lactamase class C family)